MIPLRSLLGATLLATLALRGSIPAQDDRSERLGNLLIHFAAAFEARELELLGGVKRSKDHPIYGRDATPRGLLRKSGGDGLNHATALRRMLAVAVDEPAPELIPGLFALATVTRGAFDGDSLRVRELARAAVVKIDDSRIWFAVMQVAEGKSAALPDLRVEDRIAAIHLLGRKRLPVARLILERQLGDRDAQLRLVVAEALADMRTVRSLDVVTAALRTEPQGIVAHALVLAGHAILNEHGSKLTRIRRARVSRAALRRLGYDGWRADVSIVNLVEEHPCLAGVPALISILERTDRWFDADEDLSPILRHRAWLALRTLTGEDIAIDDPRAWRLWWDITEASFTFRAGPKIETELRPTRGNFYGIPVMGRRLAFVIDTSGSMKAALDIEPGQGRDSREHAGKTRLESAKEQLVSAVYSIHPKARYDLVSFAAAVRVWNDRPITPTNESFAALTGILGDFVPAGGTNLFGGVEHALGSRRQQGPPSPPHTAFDEVFLLSDGEPSVGKFTGIDRILEVVRRRNRYLNVRINTVFLGDGKGAEFLRRLAEENGSTLR